MREKRKGWTRRGRDDLTCGQVTTFLLDYLDQQLEPSRQRDFEHHLAVCPPCLSYLKTYRETIRLGRLALSSDAARPAALAPELRRTILAAHQSCA